MSGDVLSHDSYSCIPVQNYLSALACTCLWISNMFENVCPLSAVVTSLLKVSHVYSAPDCSQHVGSNIANEHKPESHVTYLHLAVFLPPSTSFFLSFGKFHQESSQNVSKQVWTGSHECISSSRQDLRQDKTSTYICLLMFCLV